MKVVVEILKYEDKEIVGPSDKPNARSACAVGNVDVSQPDSAEKYLEDLIAMLQALYKHEVTKINTMHDTNFDALKPFALDYPGENIEPFARGLKSEDLKEITNG
jgi:hypothetical protein